MQVPELCPVEVVVPDGIGPGDSFTVTTAWGGSYEVACPPDAVAGAAITVSLPSSPYADTELLSRVSAFLDDDDSSMMTQIEQFCVANYHRVLDKPRSCSEELGSFSLETEEVHREFVQLVEALLEEHLVSLGLRAEDFVGVVQRVGGVSNVSGSHHSAFIIRTIESLTDFDVFVSMIQDARESGSLR